MRIALFERLNMGKSYANERISCMKIDSCYLYGCNWNVLLMMFLCYDFLESSLVDFLSVVEDMCLSMF